MWCNERGLQLLPVWRDLIPGRPEFVRGPLLSLFGVPCHMKRETLLLFLKYLGEGLKPSFHSNHCSPPKRSCFIKRRNERGHRPSGAWAPSAFEPWDEPALLPLLSRRKSTPESTAPGYKARPPHWQHLWAWWKCELPSFTPGLLNPKPWS